MQQSKTGGGARKYGRNKIKCTRYKNEDRRTTNKLRKFKKYNLPKNIPQKETDKLITKFLNMQSERRTNA